MLYMENDHTYLKIMLTIQSCIKLSYVYNKEN